jgi:hypothetical protein
VAFGVALSFPCLPGTSSVCGSANIPKFHLRGGVSFSEDVAVETPPSVAWACDFCQGVKLTMPGNHKKECSK